MSYETFTKVYRFVLCSIIIFLGVLYILPYSDVHTVKISDISQKVSEYKAGGNTKYSTLKDVKISQEGESLFIELVYITNTVLGVLETTATAKVRPAYASVQDHMKGTFTDFKIIKSEIVGKYTDELSADKLENVNVEKEFRIIINKLFESVSIASFEGLEPNAWLNNANVKSENGVGVVEFNWSKSRTVITTAIVILAIVVLILILIYCPEALFFWLLFQ